MAQKINIYGVIGSEHAGISAKQVVKQLGSIAEGDDKDISLHINSGGGYVDDAVAIFNRLRAFAKEHDATITAHIDGLAASAATLVMLAAENIVMPANASMMVHQPWGMAIGSSEDMRKSADLLDMTEDSMVAMYAERTGLDSAEIRDLLAAETWMQAGDAKAFGFVDEVAEKDDEEIEALARLAVSVYQAAAKTSEKLKSYAKVPDELGRERVEVAPQPRIAASAELPADQENGTHKQNQAPEASSTENDEMEEQNDVTEAAQVKAERARIKGIYAACAKHDIDGEHIDRFVESDKTITEVKAELLDIVANRETPISSIRVERDESENRILGVQRAIEGRAGLLSREERAKDRGNRFNSMSLAEMAFAFDNSPNTYGSRFERLGRVLAAARTSDYWGANGRPSADIGITHSVSDFTNVLANVANKSLLLGWDDAPSTHEPWTNRGVLNDFRATTRAGTNLFPNLLEVEEGAEYQGAAMGDRGNTIQLATYGRTFGISRQALINDDLQAFTEVPRKMGMAARRTVNNTVYAVLTANDNLADGDPLFDAAHNNTSAIDIDADGLATLKAAMRTQTGPDTSEELNIQPRYLVVPAALEYTAQVLLNAGYISDGTTTISNVISGLELVVEPRLDASSATTIYMMADGSMYDTIEVAYLGGNDAPRLESKDGWRTDGAEFKVGIDFGVAVRDFRGMQRGT